MTQEERDRNAHMHYLRFERGWTLQRVADYYGVSKQRVHQILGNTGWASVDYRRDFILSHPQLTNDELSKILDLTPLVIGSYRRNTRYKYKDGARRQGQLFEQMVGERLDEHRIKYEWMPANHPFDILINGKHRLEVKATSVRVDEYASQPNCVSPTYQWNLHERDEADYYALWIMDENTCYVVPDTMMPPAHYTVRICHPVTSGYATKYEKYHEAWELLKEA